MGTLNKEPQEYSNNTTKIDLPGSYTPISLVPYSWELPIWISHSRPFYNFSHMECLGVQGPTKLGLWRIEWKNLEHGTEAGLIQGFGEACLTAGLEIYINSMAIFQASTFRSPSPQWFRI